MAGLYVQLDTNWPDNPKVIAAGLNGAGLHALALCLAKRLLTDGVVHRSQLLRYDGVTPELIDWLVDCGLFDAVDNDRVRVHDWAQRNDLAYAIARRSGARSGDGKRGNHKRYKHGGEVLACPICYPENAQAARPSDRGAIASPRPMRSPPLARDIDRDTSTDAHAGAREAAVHKAEENGAKVKAILDEPPPPTDITAQGIAAARQAAHREKPA